MNDRHADIGQIQASRSAKQVSGAMPTADTSEQQLVKPILVGRAGEQGELEEFIQLAQIGPPGAAVLLTGESGVGKTALAEWCLAEAQASCQFVVVQATCEPFHAGMSFFPIHELNRRLAGTSATVQQLIAQGYGEGSNESHWARSAFDDSADPAIRREYMMATLQMPSWQRRA
jgi:DNA-binding NtrC family response regulator